MAALPYVVFCCKRCSFNIRRGVESSDRQKIWSNKQANDRLEHDWVGVSNTDQDVWLQDVNRHLEQVTELRLNA